MALIPPSRLVKQSEVTLRPVWLEMPCFCHRAMLTPESSPSVTGSAWQAGTLLLATGSAGSCPGFGWDPESVCEPYLSGGGREWRHPGHLRGQRLGPPLPRDVTQWARRSLRFLSAVITTEPEEGESTPLYQEPRRRKWQMLYLHLSREV